MKSEWRVSWQVIGDEKLYSVYRLRDINEVHHSGNRETAGGLFEDEKSAEDYARMLNETEEQRG